MDTKGIEMKTETLELTPRESEAMLAVRLRAVLRWIPEVDSAYHLWGPAFCGFQGFSTNETQGEKGTTTEAELPFAVGDVVVLESSESYLEDGSGGSRRRITDCWKVTITDVRAVRVNNLNESKHDNLGYDGFGEKLSEVFRMENDWNAENPNAPFEASWAFYISWEDAE